MRKRSVSFGFSFGPDTFLGFRCVIHLSPLNLSRRRFQGNGSPLCLLRRVMFAFGTKRTYRGQLTMSASLIGHSGSSAFRLSTTTVSMSLTGSCFSSESAPVALPSWDSRTRWNNLLGGLAVRRTAGPSGHANSPHPSSREGHHSTARWGSIFLLLDLILHGFHAAAAACSRVQRNSVPSTQMRCMITASRRAKATIAFFMPRRLAICIAQALSHDHFFDRSML